ncbi:MAG: cytidine deaminase [Clostridiales bacterium GWB2_37_7]|nr:MAG: cytidine deaminase [Clostridiales bacterium GWB2_37_7]
MRPTWDEYFMNIVDMIKTRSTCMRRQVGAVIVRDKRILTTGYNGTPSGLKHCVEVGCLRDELKIPSGERHELCRGIHAEQNAIIQAAVFGVPIQNSTIYTNVSPCILCTKMIINSGITRIVTREAYHDALALKMLAESNIEYVKL